jgi:spore photoproduct lyase
MQKPDKLYIEKGVEDFELTKKILGRLNPIDIEYVEDYKKIGFDKDFVDRANEDKDSLALGQKKGEVLKSIGRMGNGQYYLFHEMDCKYDCEYCYLQYYFQTKVPVIFVNRSDVIDRMKEAMELHSKTYFHVGEICDSLAFDDLTDFSLDLAELVKDNPNCTIEFRTKSTNIENLLSIENPTPNIIPSWTMSPQIVSETLEHKTPKFSDRLAAAKACQKKGYTVGIRIDPIIIYEDWENGYSEMIRQIMTTLDPKCIDYITLGSIKIHKLLTDVIRKRFPKSKLLLGEIFPSEDGKYRYLKFQRVEVYKKIMSWIRDYDSSIKVELSLETEDIRELVFS